MTAPWLDQRLLDLLEIEHPIVLAPMAGSGTPDLAAAVSNAGGLGSLGCAALLPPAVLAAVGRFRGLPAGPVNLNFFCHSQTPPDPELEAAWRARLTPLYRELGLSPDLLPPPMDLPPFEPALCDVVEQTKPEVVSFHFGLPDRPLLDRVKRGGCAVLFISDHRCRGMLARGERSGCRHRPGHRGWRALQSDPSSTPAEHSA